MFDTILGWIGSFLGWLDSITGNYVWALFIFAIIVEIILLPFAVKQQQNSIKQAKLRPKEMAIRNKYKGRNDRATQMKVSEEIQAMYQKENFSPFSGCLQLFIQMPVILVLYQVVINPLQHVLHVSNNAITAMQTYVTAAVEEGGLGLTVNSQRGTIELISIIKEKGMEFFSGIVGYVDSVGSVKGFGISGQETYDAFAAVADKMPDFTVFGILLFVKEDKGTVDHADVFHAVALNRQIKIFFDVIDLGELVAEQRLVGDDRGTRADLTNDRNVFFTTASRRYRAAVHQGIE